MKGMGREFMLIVGASAVLYILVAHPDTSGKIIDSLGGSTTKVIAALQGRDATAS